MIRRMTNKGSVGVVIDEEIEDIMFCPSCQKNGGVLSKLRELIHLDDNDKLLPPPPDANEFKRCYTCGLVVPVREAKKQGKISGITGIDIIQNPFDQGRGIILGNDARLSNRIKNLKKQAKHPDKEVQKHLDDGYELTSYLNSMPQ